MCKESLAMLYDTVWHTNLVTVCCVCVCVCVCVYLHALRVWSVWVLKTVTTVLHTLLSVLYFVHGMNCYRTWCILYCGVPY